MAALYFQGNARPQIIKSNQIGRPDGNFFMGGSEPVKSASNAGKKTLAPSGGNFPMYGNYGTDEEAQVYM